MTSNADPAFSDEEQAALHAFQQAHMEFARGHFKEAERQFLAIILNYPGVPEVSSRSKTFLESARVQLRKSAENLNPPTGNSDELTDPYEVLGVGLEATDAEIISAFRKLAQMYHPDKVESLAPEYREISKRRMLQINLAYEAIMRKR